MNIPILCAGAGQFAYLSTMGEIKILSAANAQIAIGKNPVLVCHAPYTLSRLGSDRLQTLDILELFAFVHPTRFCVPTPAGLAKALGQVGPQALEDYPLSLQDSVQFLLDDLKQKPNKDRLLSITEVMGLNGRGWGWTPHIFAALGETYDPAKTLIGRSQLNVWKNLPEWAEDAPVPPESHFGISGEETRARLQDILKRGTGNEMRAPQLNYTTRMAETFQPKQYEDDVTTLLAEAGTGVGKTLGYLVPASLWAEKNEGSVWISTYTKNLQRQIESELARIYPVADIRDKKVSIRKGRENYLCLLNFDDLATASSTAYQIRTAVAAGIMARWVMETKDGDLSGSDFPGWLTGLLGYAGSTGLADRRGECIYSACEHYHRCFTERALRKAKQTPIVVANHAVVMIQTALSTTDDDLPHRYIFDEGHHIFDAADSAFGGHLTGIETYDLRRWLLGPEGGRRSRSRGLKKRVEDLLAGDEEGLAILERILHASKFLTAEDWLLRLKENNPRGSAEAFLLKVQHQVIARADGRHGPYSLETSTFPLIEDFLPATDALKADLSNLRAAMIRLSAYLRQKLNTEAETLAPDNRRRLDAVAQSLDRRSQMTISGWISMLETLASGLSPIAFVDWMSVERVDGRIYDIGFYRHHTDPTEPFAKALKPHAHSVAITSATLREASSSASDIEGWESANTMTGARHLSSSPVNFSIPSPFDYPKHTRVFVVNDIRRDDLDQLATAYRELFKASAGGGLGLFTSIQRLRAVHKHIETPLAQEGLSLFSQHVDGIDIGTLIDMFRDDTHSCLLGTDAVRDGVDVPGESLRMIVFDRVPWPRATILHKSRRHAFGGNLYDDRLTRLKLKQAYGRLIRKATDRGVFIMLDSSLPSRLLNAFPDGVTVERIGLSQAIVKTKDFLQEA